jgi:hypothetical protein
LLAIPTVKQWPITSAYVKTPIVYGCNKGGCGIYAT